jgi:hypothetical protein
MLALDARRDELDSEVEEDADDSGIEEELKDELDSEVEEDVDSLRIKLVFGMDGVDVDEGKGITHPIKINAKNGIAMPTNLNKKFFFMIKLYTLAFKKKEAFSCSEGLKNL